MTTDSSSQLPIENGLRKPGEESRSPEFKAARDQLVTDVNTTVDTQLYRAEAGEITNEPLSRVTVLGRTGHNLTTIATESNGGEAAWKRNGVTAYERVYKDESGLVVHVHAVGSDELRQMMGTDYDHKGQTEVVALFEESRSDDAGTLSHISYRITADGQTAKMVFEEGIYKHRPVRTPEDIQMAETFFQSIMPTRSEV